MANFPTVTITDADDGSTAYGTSTKYQRVPIDSAQIEGYPQMMRIAARSTGQLGATFTMAMVLVDPANVNAAAGTDYVRDYFTFTVADTGSIRADKNGTAGSYLCTVTCPNGGDTFDLAGGAKAPTGYEWRVGSPNSMTTATAVILEFIPINVI